MARRGGAATTAGIEYQYWFTAWKIAELFFDESESNSVSPECNYRNSSPIVPKESPEISRLLEVDDLRVEREKVEYLYNIKYRTEGYWTLNRLSKAGVLDQLKNEFTKKHKHPYELVFISESPLKPRLKETLKRVRGANNIVGQLDTKENQKAWEAWKAALKFNDKEMFDFAQVFSAKTLLLEDIRESIRTLFLSHVTNAKATPDHLYALATRAGRNQRTITKEILIKELEKKGVERRPHLAENLLSERLASSSRMLIDEITTFKNRSEKCYYLERDVVNKLYKWCCQEPIGKRGILGIVHGIAGVGKTVILQKVFEELQKNNIKVLGLKADLDSLSNEKELKELLFSAKYSYDNVVLLVDQLDALSLNLAKDRTLIRKYQHFIREFASKHSIKVILSCRTPDLEADPLIKRLVNSKDLHVRKFEIEKLTPIELKRVFKELGIPKNVSRSLFPLLQIPVYLRLFCQIYSKDLKMAQITTVSKLFDEFLENIKDKAQEKWNRIEEFLLDLVGEMSKEVSIGLPTKRYRRKYQEEMIFCRSNSLIKENKDQIQFFHQTFFDYMFASYFLKHEKQNLNKYVLRHIDQGIFIRNRIVQVCDFMRDECPKAYKKAVKKLLGHQRTRIHIKHLLVQYIAKQQEPSQEECWLLEKKILGIPFLEEVFQEQVLYKGWFRQLHKMELLKEWGKQFLSDSKNKRLPFLFRRLSKVDPVLFTKIFSNREYTEADSDEILWCLLITDEIDWHCEGLLGLCDKLMETSTSNIWIKIMNGIVRINPDWAVKKFMKFFTSFIHEADYDISHPVISFLKSSQKYVSALNATNLSQEISKELILKDQFPRRDGYYIESATFEDVIAYDDANKQIRKLAKKLKEFFFKTLLILENQSIDDFKKQIQHLLNSDMLEIVNFGLELLSSTHKKYPDLFMGAFRTVKAKAPHLLERNNGTSFLFRRGLTSLYEVLSDVEKEVWTNFISQLEGKVLNIGGDIDEKMCYVKDNGFLRQSYLQAIPESLRKQDRKLNRLFLEGEQNFPHLTDINPTKLISRLYAAPSRLEKPLKYLAPSSLKKRILENELYQTSLLTERDKSEYKRALCDEFRDLLKKNPTYYTDLLQELMEEVVSPALLCSGLVGIVEGEHSPEEVHKLAEAFIKVLNKRPHEGLEDIQKRFCRVLRYLIRNNQVGETLVDCLITIVRTNCDASLPEQGLPEQGLPEEDLLYMTGINSTRGSAIWNLLLINHTNKFQDKIFSLLEEIIPSSNEATRAIIVYNIYHKNDFDVEVGFKLFKLALGKNPSTALLQCSIRSGQYYLCRNSGEVRSYLMQLSRSKVKIKDFAILVARASLLGINVNDFMEPFITKADSFITGVLNVAIANFEQKRFHNKCLQLLRKCLTIKKAFVVEQLGSLLRVHKMNEKSLMIFKSDLEKFLVTMKVINSRTLSWLVLYLDQYLVDAPHIGLELLSKVQLNFIHLVYWREVQDLIKVILDCYHNLYKNRESYGDFKELTNFAMDILDQVIKNPNLRGELSRKTTPFVRSYLSLE